MSRNKDHDPENRSSQEWLDKVFNIRKVPGPMMGGKTQAQADAERRAMDNPPEDWVAPDEVTPDDDGNITVTIIGVEELAETPEAPQGVVVHLWDGSSRTAEVVWVGTGLTGIEMWEVTARYRFDEIKRITIEFLPDKSEVHIGGSGGPSAEG